MLRRRLLFVLTCVGVVLRDEFRHDKEAKRITIKTGGDPRLHLFETVVREHGFDLSDKSSLKFEEITVVHTLKAGTGNP